MIDYLRDLKYFLADWWPWLLVFTLLARLSAGGCECHVRIETREATR